MPLGESLGFTGLLENMTDQGMNTGHEQSILQLLDDELKQLIAAVRSSGKSGYLSLKLTVKEEGAERISVDPTWNTKLPAAKKVPFVGYADKRGNVTVDHPGQQQLPVREKMASIV